MNYRGLKLCGLIILLFILGCKKSDPDIVPDPVGKWEASRDVGGEYQGTVFNPGNGNIFEFTRDSFRKYENGQLTDSGSYTIFKETYKTFSYRVIFNNDFNSKYYIQVTGGNLIIDWEGFFTIIRLYTRIP
jgi:hypothetical protein